MNTLRKFKAKLAQEPVLGPFCKTSDPAIVEAIGYAGADFVILDMEHGRTGLSTLENLIRAAQLSHTASIVRLAEQQWQGVGAVLDLGASGVQMSQVCSADDLRQLVRAGRFAPQGQRGACRYVRAARYSGLPKQDYFRQANETLLIAQLEGCDALRELDSILDVGGVDVIFIGPYDLSQSLGVPGEVEHPRVVEEMTRIVERAAESGVVTGTFVETLDQANFWRTRGIHYLSYSVDVGLIYQAMRHLVDCFRQSAVKA